MLQTPPSSDSEQSSCTCDGSDNENEIWHEHEDELLHDINGNNIPLTETRPNTSMCNKATTLLKWFIYFLLCWQTTFNISDIGLEWLLRFMLKFLHLLGITTNNEQLIGIALVIPGSLYLLRKFLSLDRDSFTKFVVCPECLKLYPLDSCTVCIGDRIEASRCDNKPFRSGRTGVCGALLAKKVTTEKNGVVLYPFKVYCYNSVINQLEAILRRP